MEKIKKRYERVIREMVEGFKLNIAKCNGENYLRNYCLIWLDEGAGTKCLAIFGEWDHRINYTFGQKLNSWLFCVNILKKNGLHFRVKELLKAGVRIHNNVSYKIRVKKFMGSILE